METLWVKKHESDSIATIHDGCRLTNYEEDLLIRLSGKLSFKELTDKGFSPIDIDKIFEWSVGI